MIKVDQLVKRFATLTAVDHISFTVGQGDLLGFLGPNGAGKSTVMKMMTGFLPQDGGTVRIHGHDINQAPLAARRQLGYLPEGSPAWGEMSPLSFLRFMADMRGMSAYASKARIDELISMIHLEKVAYKPIETLSKGFKRRVGLAQALLHNPPVLLLDEPTDGLDPNQKHEVRELLRSMARDKAIVISTHLLEEVEALCNRAIIIAAGRKLFDGPTDALVDRFPDSHRLLIKLDAAIQEQALTQLGQQLPQARLGTVSGSEQGWIKIACPPGDGPLPKVLALCQQQQWQIHDLHTTDAPLDTVFRQITTEHHSEIGGFRS